MKLRSEGGGSKNQQGSALEKFEDGQYAVVNVAKPRRLALLRVVQPARPINHDVVLSFVESHRAA